MITPELIKQAIQETREFGEAKCVKYARRELPVRFYADDGSGSHPIHGAYLNDSDWICNAFRPEDFIAAPRQKTVRVYWDEYDYIGVHKFPAKTPSKGVTEKASALVTLTEGEFE